MKKLVCLIAALMLLFTACGNNPADDGTVKDGDGVIDESMSDNTPDTNGAVDDVADGANDLVDGAADATKDAVDGARNAMDDMTGNNAANR